MKSVIEILKKVRKNYHETWKHLRVHMKEFVEKLIRNRA